MTALQTNGGPTSRGYFDSAHDAADLRDGGARVARALTMLSQRLADFLYPPLCLHCRQPVSEHHGLCAQCWRGLAFISKPYCERLGAPMALDPGPGAISPAAIAAPPPWDRARAATRFEGTARELVHALKFGDRPDLARLLARLMVISGAELVADAELIVPVPLHRRRLWRRRYNQAAILAAALARTSRTPHAPAALRRIRATLPQTGLSRRARARNLRGAFVITSGETTRLKGKRILLVDDVMTTGATAAAAARALRRAGANQVDVLTFAMAVRE